MLLLIITMATLSDSSASSSHTVDVSPLRALVVDAGLLGNKRHPMYGLVQANVTTARQRMSQGLSFTGYLVACLSRAIAAEPVVQAYRKSTKKFTIFHNVDVVTMIEPSASTGAVAVPHVIRNANLKSVQEISDEIRSVQHNPDSSPQQNSKLVHLAVKLPRWFRLWLLRIMTRTPERKRQMQGTVLLTSTGMFAKGYSGWGLTFLSMHTLAVTAGGIQWQPAVVNGEVMPQEMLCLTLSFDHDIVDGAPAARFAARLVQLIESAELLVRCDGNEK